VTANTSHVSADAIVVGAGPGGSAAAIHLSRTGRRVLLIDKAAFPRDKCCGDGLTAAALRRLQRLGLDPGDVASWQGAQDVSVITASGRRVDLALPRDGLFAAIACRRDLDFTLLQLAERSGAVVMPECGLESIASGPDGILTVGTSDGRELRAPYVVAADGMWSPTRKALGLSQPGYLGEWQAGRQYFQSVGPECRRLWIWFEPDMIPGYAWSFPLPGNRANVGYGVLRSADRHAASRRPRPDLPRGQQVDLLDRPHIAEVLGSSAMPSSPWRAWPIPTGIFNATLSALEGRVLFVGDAARGADPMTGEGIAQALELAEMAAGAIARSGPRAPAGAARRYERAVRFGISVDHHLSQALARVLARPSGSDRALRVIEGNPRWRAHFARWMFEDYPRALPITPHRWKKHAASGSGAYAEERQTFASRPN
jgi:geranylgeranyl reductase family protein